MSELETGTDVTDQQIIEAMQVEIDRLTEQLAEQDDYRLASIEWKHCAEDNERLKKTAEKQLDYVYPTIDGYSEIGGHNVNDHFRWGFAAARLTAIGEVES